MIAIQTIGTTWTKASRGGELAVMRGRVPKAMLLQSPSDFPDVLWYRVGFGERITLNPYAPPKTESKQSSSGEQATARRGPALYIIFAGLVGGIGSVPFLAVQSPLALLAPLVGCVAGGLLFRSVSQDWPHDPSVRPRQILFSFLALTVLPAALVIAAGIEAHRLPFAVIGLSVGGAVAAGIMISGTRRLRGTPKLSDQ